MPFSMMVGMMSVVRLGILARYPNLRCAFLEIGATWFPYWAWWVGKHIEHVPRTPGATDATKATGAGHPTPCRKPSGSPWRTSLPDASFRASRTTENLRSIIDQVGAGSLNVRQRLPPTATWIGARVDAIKSNDAITREERDALLGGNAQRFYKLEL